jgi:SAP domain
MPSAPSKADPRWTLAHLMLLSKFSGPRTGRGPWGDQWKWALGEDRSEAIRRFVEAGLLVRCALSVSVAFKLSSSQLKQMLGERGLKVSGRKDEMAERLCKANAAEMERAVAGMNLLTCSEGGRQLAGEFLTRSDEMKWAALAALREKNPGLACRVVSEWQDALGFPELPMIQTKPDLGDVSRVFSVRPRILSGVNEEAFKQLRVTAGMAFLGLGDRWLPGNLETGIRLAGPSAVSMIISSVQISRNVEGWRSSGVVRTVKILCCADGPCEACNALRNCVWPIGDLPEIPYEHCTSPGGCRCVCVADLIEG